jgi:hypothetical protein
VISGLQSTKIQLTAEEIFEINELLPESKPLDPDVENTLHVL